MEELWGTIYPKMSSTQPHGNENSFSMVKKLHFLFKKSIQKALSPMQRLHHRIGLMVRMWPFC